jgi:nucleotide-binding universal stress UspA family protein
MQILCATDGSISGDAALRVSAELADRLHAELAMLDADASDPAPQLLRAGRATGCDLITVGVVATPRARGWLPDGWQRRVVHNAPCPVMLVPVGAGLPPGGSVVLAPDVAELPSQAARVAGRLAGRLRAPLIITHVLSDRVSASPTTESERYSEAQVLAGQAQRAAGGPLTVRQASSRWQDANPLAEIAAHHEAALVVLGGRGPGRPLLPRRRRAHRLPIDTRLPIIVATAHR